MLLQQHNTGQVFIITATIANIDHILHIYSVASRLQTCWLCPQPGGNKQLNKLWSQNLLHHHVINV